MYMVPSLIAICRHTHALIRQECERANEQKGEWVWVEGVFFFCHSSLLGVCFFVLLCESVRKCLSAHHEQQSNIELNSCRVFHCKSQINDKDKIATANSYTQFCLSTKQPYEAEKNNKNWTMHPNHYGQAMHNCCFIVDRTMSVWQLNKLLLQL